MFYNSEDPYIILGVSRNNTITEITHQYRKLALKFHPDKNKNDKNCEEQFKNITKAYNDIINKHKNTPQFKTSFLSNIKYLKDLLFNSESGEIDTILNSLIKEINVITNIYNDKLSQEKTENLNINVIVDIFDIYNSIKKTITIKRLRKCNSCLTHGFIIGKQYYKCNVCNGDKIIEENIDLTFNCNKNIHMFHKLSNHSLNKSPGDIILNIIPKFHINSKLTEIKLDNYEIINYYNLLYIHRLEKYDSIEILSKEKNIIIEFTHLDNIKYKFKISNPTTNYRYEIPDMGLLNSNGTKRGSLYTILVLKKNITNSSITMV